MISLNEHQEQCLVIAWCLKNESKDPRLEMIFAIPNGLWSKNTGVARKAVAEGLKSGVPDLLLAVAAQGFNGLFVEMKREFKSSTPQVQKDWHRKLAKQGYKCEVCKGHKAAIRVIADYLAVEYV